MTAEEGAGKGAESEEITISPFLDMRDPTFRRILRAATAKFNQMICPLMASVCVRDLCMFWNDRTESCLIVDGLKSHLYRKMCPKCQSTNVEFSEKSTRMGKNQAYKCENCGNEWSSVH